MRVLILGASGMLGHKLYQHLRLRFDVFTTIRSTFGSISRFDLFDKDMVVENVDACDLNSVRAAIERTKPDVVINALGVIKQLPESEEVIKTLSINSVFPQRLSAACH